MMSANKKVVLIVLLGVGACLMSFFISRYFIEKDHNNQAFLSRIQQTVVRVEHLRLLGRGFIRNADPGNWQRINRTMASIRGDLAASAKTPGDWQAEMAALKISLEGYHGVLRMLNGPAVSLKAQKEVLQGIGISFSNQVEEQIIRPYRKEEGLRTYHGDAIDPFKSRIKDTAYDLVALHIKQQLILLELLLSSDLDAYRHQKQDLIDALAKHKAQLRFLNVLMGNEPKIQPVIKALDKNLADLVVHEGAIIENFSVLVQLEQRLNDTGEILVAASRALSDRIVADTLRASRLNRWLNWGLILGLVVGLFVLGSLLARDIIRFVHDLNETQQDLTASESNLRVTLNSIGDAVISTDEEGKIVRMNKAAEGLTGWNRADAFGEALDKVFVIVNAHTRQKVDSPADRVLAEGRTVGLANHAVLLAKDGSEYQIADSGAPIRNTDDQIIGVVLVFRDVTEAYAREQQIRESERLLKHVTSNIPGVVYQFRATADHRYTNTFIGEKAVALFGIEAPPEAFFAEFAKCIPDSEKEAFQASVSEAVDRVAPWHYEGRFIKPDGEMIWFAGDSASHRSEDEVVFNGVLTDITQRRRMEEALRLTQFCFDRASFGIFRTGPDARILTVNDQACKSLGYSREDLCQMTIFDIDPGFHKEAWAAHRKNVRDSGAVVIETTHRRKDGSVFPVEILINFMEYRNEGFSISFVMDITDRVAMAKEANRLEKALQQAQKMEAIGTLAGGIAHDFNNILSAVIGYAELALADETAGTPLHRNLRQILAAGMRAGDLVRQILTFSRQEERQLKPLQVGPLVKEAIKMLRSSLPTTVEITQEIDEDLDNVMADPTQIHQIVMNLCTNAAHAMEGEGGRLKVGLSQVHLTSRDIRLHPGLMPGDYVKLLVQDTGPGIAPEVLGNIYNPYFTTKEKGKGTGLGLSVVHGILQSYHGAVYAYSELGNGASFNVYIPAIKQERAKEGKEASNLPGGCEHILLVDDEPILIEVEQQMLEKLGYTVTPCSGSPEALAAFRQSPWTFDLVITDMTMPKMTGDKLAAELIRIRPDIPVILSTGYSRNMTDEKAREIGIQDFIPKPVLGSNLAETVRRVLDGASRDP
ncbi:MAG: PAS domain S-box protein [Desulfobacterales bacterium]|nr:PAS domain S-box protein [Desulfobacterales bacterium]